MGRRRGAGLTADASISVQVAHLGERGEERRGEDRVEHPDRGERDHHRLVDCSPNAFGAALDVHSLVTADGRDDEAEQARLDDAAQELGDGEVRGEGG